MNQSYPFGELQQKMASARNILVVFPQKASFDHVAASLSLYLSLKKAGKSVSLVSSEPMRVEFSHLVGVDQVQTKIAGGDLVITLDYPISNIDKVSYNDDGGKLNLVVKIKPGSSPLTQNQAIFNSSAGGSFDLVFLVGVSRPEDLGPLLKDDKDSLKKDTVVSINNSPSSMGVGNFIDQGASGCTEIVANIIRTLALPIDEDIGANILQGLRQTTQNFQDPKTTPSAFEMAAFALKMGGKRKPVTPSPLPQTEKPKEKKPSPDWFEPKIYRGTKIS